MRKESCSYLSAELEEPDHLEEMLFQFDLETKHICFQWKLPEFLETEEKHNSENHRLKQF
jgi:hypothetical protein